MTYFGVTDKFFAFIVSVYGLYSIFAKDEYKTSTKIILLLLIICTYLVIKVVELYIKLKTTLVEKSKLSKKNNTVTKEYKKFINENKNLKQYIYLLQMAVSFYKDHFVMLEQLAPTSSKKNIEKFVSLVNKEGGNQIEKAMESHKNN